MPLAFALLLAALVAPSPGPETPAPNIVLVLADDLGIGDARCYNPDSKVPTPAIDRLAREGRRFTDAHSPSAVCTPTRYALLTGRYAWRSRLHRWVLDGYGRLLVDRPTVATAFDEAGYTTACIGKWHLGLGAFDPDEPGRKADYGGPFAAGPHTCGFDEVFILPASLDMPPYAFVRGDALEEPLTAETPGSERRWSGGGGFWREGPMAPSFDFEQVLPRVVEEACTFLEQV
ncbi:MAG: sulfatase-like hydrolase/transferase, partial [Phycisphaerales bacterium]|nr:sulfatase-like hydrolase/transferase [Phycisphaerales bacterium]